MVKTVFNRKKLSLTQQWVGTALLSMFPLIIAVAYAVWEMGAQAHAQQRLVMNQAQLSNLGVATLELSKEIERSARQFELLQDPSLLEILNIKNNQFTENLNIIKTTLPTPIVLATLNKLKETSKEISHIIKQSSEMQKPALEALYSDLKSSSGTLNRQLGDAVKNLLSQSEKDINLVLWRIIITGFIAIPASLLLLGAGSLIATRSIRRLSLSIHHLGHRKWDRKIEIDGPSDLIELGHLLEWMRVQLITAEQQKAQFTQHITHELKSPLAAIMDAQSLLAEQIPGKINEQQLTVLNILRTQAENLQELIQQLLNYNAISRGVDAHSDQINLNSMCNKLIRRYRNFLPESSIKINCDSHSNIVIGNAQLIEMILSNLLSNAIHFCPADGAISVKWGYCNIDKSHPVIDNSSALENASHWWLQVSDNGPGIDLEEQEAVFRPFYQGRNKRHGSLKGSGIGLAIVKACAEQSAATLRLKSKRNEGAEFTLCFPNQR